MKILVVLVTVLFSLDASAVILRGESREQITDPVDEKAKKVRLLEMWNNKEPSK